jgi:site-specific recombinase XerD
MPNLTPFDPSLLPARPGSSAVPAIVAAGGEDAAYRFLEFFAAHIRNRNTRAAYYRNVCSFFRWLEARHVHELAAIRSHHVAAYVEQMTRTHAAPTAKQHLAAIRMLFDWLIVGQVLSYNPAAATRGPKHVVETGKTPVLPPDEARKLLDSIPTDTMSGLRDRALIALLVYSFARISAALAMNVRDYYPSGKKWWLRLKEKGGKHHEMPAHHELEEVLDAYITAAGIADDKKGPLFRTVRGRTGVLTEERLDRVNAWQMIRRRARQAGILTPIGNHTWRATGITAYLTNGGELEKAQRMAAHSSPRTTKLYDRRADKITLDEIERIVIK